jgi:hypothetical protein
MMTEEDWLWGGAVRTVTRTYEIRGHEWRPDARTDLISKNVVVTIYPRVVPPPVHFVKNTAETNKDL